MAYRSDVRVKMGKKAYELLVGECMKSELDYVRDLVNKPDDFQEENDAVYISWNYFKWHTWYEDVAAIDRVVLKLNELVEDDPNLLEDYYYKMIVIGEDNATEESTNDYDEEFTDDFYVIVKFSK